MYIVEGNIGAGKSTFLKLLEKHLSYITIVLEPLNNWHQTSDGQSLLANFYQNPRRWAYSLETLTMICRVHEHRTHQQNITKKPNRIFERSIYSGHFCFAHNSYAAGFMTDLEWKLYDEWFNFLIPNQCKPPLGFIYLRVDPEIAYERIKKRNRSAETNISLEYLKQIHDRHENFLINNKQSSVGISLTPVLILDCNNEFEADAENFKQHMKDVELFLAQTQQTYKPANADWHMFRQGPIIEDEQQTL